MTQDVPAKVIGQSLRRRASAMRAGHGRMVLKPVAADVLHQLRQSRHLDNGLGPERVERIVRECTFADVSSNPARQIVGAHSPKGDWPRRRPPSQRADRICLAQYCAEDRSRPNPNVGQKSFAQLPQWKKTHLSGSEP